MSNFEESTPRFSDKEYSLYYELKKIGLERILGTMDEVVGHAIIAFCVGGPVDMYRFTNGIPGTAFATMELIEPDGTGPKPSRIGTFELVAFTRHKMDDSKFFNKVELRIRSMLTSIARLSYFEVMNPMDTCEIPGNDGMETRYLVLGEWKKGGIVFHIGDRKHGLLLCIEVFKNEMEFAMKQGSKALFQRLKERGYYPYSDLDREPVA
jgi:hypothetical protein